MRVAKRPGRAAPGPTRNQISVLRNARVRSRSSGEPKMLANLKANYARIRDVEGLTAVMRMRSCLPGMVLDEGRELVRLLDAVGCWDEASFSLDQLETQNPSAVMELGVERDRLRARLN